MYYQRALPLISNIIIILVSLIEFFRDRSFRIPVLRKKKKKKKYSTEVRIRSLKSMSLEAVNIVLPDKRDQGKVCFIVKNVFSPEECQELIDYSESIGYVPALLNNGSSESLELDIRNSWRVIADDHTRAANIYERIKQFLPKSIVDKYTDKKYEPVSVNERCIESNISPLTCTDF